MKINLLLNLILKIMILVVLFLSFNACEEEGYIKEINKIIKQVSQYSDSSFVSNNVGSFVSTDNNIWIAEHENARIVRVDSKFNVVAKYGRKGNGPGEFNGLFHIAKTKEKVFAVDLGGNRMNVYNIKGEFINEFKIPSTFWPNKFAIDENNKIYFSSTENSSSIIVIDEKGERLDEIQFSVPEKLLNNTYPEEYRSFLI